MAAVDPMDLVKAESTSIPLLCLLCPRDPKFSDVSHLLTHISSKTHLSNRFHLELKSKQEARAKQRLNRYEEWYNDHGIEGLLQARMNAKDQKKGSKRQKNGQSKVSALTSHDRLRAPFANAYSSRGTALQVVRPEMASKLKRRTRMILSGDHFIIGTQYPCRQAFTCTTSHRAMHLTP
jgi:hypothetical protein